MSKLDEQIEHMLQVRGDLRITEYLKVNIKSLITSTIQEIMPEKRGNREGRRTKAFTEDDYISKGFNQAVSQMEQNAKENGIEL